MVGFLLSYAALDWLGYKAPLSPSCKALLRQSRAALLRLSYIAPLKLSYKAPELHGSLKLSYKAHELHYSLKLSYKTLLKLSYYMAPKLRGSLATWLSRLSGSL